MEDRYIYFIGIGGIGMSALARFFLAEGWKVAGYDRTESAITKKMEELGAAVSYVDDVAQIPAGFLGKGTQVVYTPAIPQNSAILRYYADGGYKMMKRAAALGKLSEGKFLMAVAGSHGKSTTSTLAAHIDSVAAGEGSAFLGAISKNFDSNLVIGKGDRLVVEADEFDRSFLQLNPNAAVITAVDPDHLDIYHTADEFSEGFAQFVERIKPGGRLILRKGVNLKIRNSAIDVYSYALDDCTADYHAENLRIDAEGFFTYDIVTPSKVIRDCQLGVRGIVNVENSIGAVALVDSAGFDDGLLREALRTFAGIKRRFDFHVVTPGHIYMDDYAHHPGELEAMLSSVRRMFPGRKITIAFQPHLYTRTRDFATGFSNALSKADEVWLLPIYPARELPIEGVTSDIILRNVTTSAEIVQYGDLVEKVRSRHDLDIFVTAGAGDIDRLVEPITQVLNEQRR